MKSIPLLVFLFVMCLVVGSGFGQSPKKKDKDKRGIEKYIPTENTKLSKFNYIPKEAPRETSYQLIYKSNTKGILYGNPCAYKATHAMGFEYIVEPNKKGAPNSRSRVGKFLNNLWVKTTLVVTRSPFWKANLNKRFKRCQQGTGDIKG